MKKKIWLWAAAALLCVTLSACGGTQEKLPELKMPETGSSAASGEEASQTAEKETPDDGFEDHLDGLCAYLEANNAVIRNDQADVASASSDPSFTEMSFKEIGAIGGYRYKFTFNGSTVQAEFYEFDTENLNEKGKDCLDSVKSSGKFTVLDNEVAATLSDNGKYLMVYTDPRTEEANVSQREKVERLFKGFKAKP